MEKLIRFLNSLSVEQRTAFASACNTSEGYLRKAASKKQKLGAETCVRIEQESHFQITRRDLRPDDWRKIWPELARQDDQPAIQAETVTSPEEEAA